MTTQTNAYPIRRSPLGAFFLIILLMLLSYAAIQVILGTHAATRHPDTYAAARDCLNKNGVWKVYQEPKPTDNTFHWLCQDPVTKTVYDMIVEKINETTYHEKTAFMPKDGTWNKVFRWLIEGEGKRGGTWQNPPTGPIELLPP